MNKEYKYFISGRIECERKNDSFDCTLRPYVIMGKYERKYMENQRHGFNVGNVSMMNFGDATEVKADKNRIVAEFLNERKRVCVVYGTENKILDCRLSVEEKFEYEKPPSLSRLMRDAERWG